MVFPSPAMHDDATRALIGDSGVGTWQGGLRVVGGGFGGVAGDSGRVAFLRRFLASFWGLFGGSKTLRKRQLRWGITLKWDMRYWRGGGDQCSKLFQWRQGRFGAVETRNDKLRRSLSCWYHWGPTSGAIGVCNWCWRQGPWGSFDVPERLWKPLKTPHYINSPHLPIYINSPHLHQLTSTTLKRPSSTWPVLRLE